MLLAGSQRPNLSGERFDVAIIGGGINGVAIARECARAGRRTLLVEQHDFCSGTTSRATRIIHGGLRYLEHGEIGLVRESLREREYLLRSYPNHVRPLQFLLPLSSDARRSALEVRFGLWLYRKFAGAKSQPRAKDEIRRLEALLDHGRRWTVFSYDDAQCEFPERLTATWLTEAVGYGCVARNHAEMLEIEIRDRQVTGLRIRDRLDGREFRIETAAVINASGPWADRVCAASGLQTEHPLIGGVRGSHVVSARFPGAPGSAIYTEAPDGRPIFIIPWNSQLLVGTTEVPDSGDPNNSQPSADEIAYLVGTFNRIFPRNQITTADIRYAFAGIRPLPFVADGKPASVTRRHFLHDHTDNGARGLISVVGGKLTTAGSLARECARLFGIESPEPLRVAISEIVPGAPCDSITEWFGPAAERLRELAKSDPRLSQPLCPHTEHTVAEAIFAVRHEFAVTAADILLRRVPVALGPCWTDECTRSAIGGIGGALGWSEIQQRLQQEAFEDETARFLRRPAGMPADTGPALAKRFS